MKPLIIMLCCITVSLCTFIIDRGLTQRAEIELRTASRLDEVSKRSDRTAAELAKQIETLRQNALVEQARRAVAERKAATGEK